MQREMSRSRMQSDGLARTVVNIIANYDGESIAFDTLCSRLGIRDKYALINPLSEFADIFDVSKHGVELIVSAKLCPEYCSKSNCRDNNCSMFHICKFYILSDDCITTDESCKFGHNLVTGHNKKLLHNLMLDQVPLDQLRFLFRLPRNRTAATIPHICNFYNIHMGCSKGRKCTSLHICRHYVWGSCKFDKKCIRSHQIEDINLILNKYGINTRRHPGEIIEELKTLYEDVGTNNNYTRKSPTRRLAGAESMPSLVNIPFHACQPPLQQSDRRHTNQLSEYRPRSHAARQAPTSPYQNLRFGSASDVSFENLSPVPQHSAKFQNRRQMKRNVTVDTEPNFKHDSPSEQTICLYHLRGKCFYKEICRNEHKPLIYQWQYRRKSDTWKDFSDEWNIKIETEFCSLQNKFYYKSDRSQKVYMIDLVDFDKSDKEIRRLSTAALSKITSPCDEAWTTKWLWYWQESDSQWTQYGKSNIAGHRSNVSSTDLEEFYQSRTNQTMQFTSETSDFLPSQTYIIDFRKMNQRNTELNTERKIIRRPEFVNEEILQLRIRRCTGQHQSLKFDTPPTWTVSTDEDVFSHFQIVKLARNSDEYREISNKFTSELGENLLLCCSVDKIERIENGELWRAFCETKGVLKRKLKKDVEEEHLYHGTEGKIVEAIQRQGFDCRLAGSRVGQLYGRGAYFGKTSAVSLPYCDRGYKMFIVKALIGDYVKGSKEFSRPPLKNAADPSSLLYDCCVNDMDDPTIFVMFNNDQVYPEYVITFKMR